MIVIAEIGYEGTIFEFLRRALFARFVSSPTVNSINYNLSAIGKKHFRSKAITRNNTERQITKKIDVQF